jgi:putative sigma-54 modulation protein
MELTDALRSYTENALGKLASHFDHLLEASVVLDIQKHRHIAEINLLANGVRIHGKEVSSDMYASVDAVIAKLEKQIRKHKDRINRHKPRISLETADYGHAILSIGGNNGHEPNEAEVAAFQPREIQREKLPMKPMSVDEAVLQLDLVDEPFLVFSNADTSRVNVLYSRDDGTYGLIEPQF